MQRHDATQADKYLVNGMNLVSPTHLLDQVNWCSEGILVAETFTWPNNLLEIWNIDSSIIYSKHPDVKWKILIQVLGMTKLNVEWKSHGENTIPKWKLCNTQCLWEWE